MYGACKKGHREVHNTNNRLLEVFVEATPEDRNGAQEGIHGTQWAAEEMVELPGDAAEIQAKLFHLLEAIEEAGTGADLVDPGS